MILDLKKYVDEVAALIEPASHFIARESQSSLNGMLRDLEIGRDNPPDFPWRTTRPIKTIIANQYDRREGAKDPVYICLGFDANFSKRGDRKSNDWCIERMNTHIKIFKQEGGEPVIHIHIDKKNVDQRGPEVHLQLSEGYTGRLGGLRIGVPRIPFGFLMPTDCLDFVLAEFFSVAWSRTQAGAHRITMIKNAQLARAYAFAHSVDRAWTRAPRQTPVSVLQDCSFAPEIRIG